MFSLGGKEQEQDQHNNSSLFLIKNEENYNKGFELWQQYYQLHQQRLHHHENIQDVVFSVGPSSSQNRNNNNISDECSNFRVKRQSRGGNEGMNCQDCGNQAKKDCVHLRCRTCCKSRGFQCQTHVKSTWVSAAKRRERQQQLADLQQDDDQHHHQQLTPKRLRENTGGGGTGGGGSALALATSRLPSSSSGFELGQFPAEVNSPAVFRCVRVSAVDDDAEEHLGFQTAVNIGGHVFKGILYDQGPESSSGQQALASASAAATSNPHVTAMLEYPSICPTPLNAFMAGTQFFPPPRP